MAARRKGARTDRTGQPSRGSPTKRRGRAAKKRASARSRARPRRRPTRDTPSPPINAAAAGWIATLQAHWRAAGHRGRRTALASLRRAQAQMDPASCLGELERALKAIGLGESDIVALLVQQYLVIGSGGAGIAPLEIIVIQTRSLVELLAGSLAQPDA